MKTGNGTVNRGVTAAIGALLSLGLPAPLRSYRLR
jgi:hypothetical protein